MQILPDGMTAHGKSNLLTVPKGLPNSSHGCKPVEKIMSKTQDPDGVSHSLAPRRPSGTRFFWCSTRKEAGFGGDGHPARHVLVGQASCLSHLIDGLEARPTGIKSWKPSYHSESRPDPY